MKFSRPLWHRTFLLKIWPLRFILAGLSRWPLVGWLIGQAFFNEDFIRFLPHRKAIRNKEKVVLPGIVVDHFIEKASFRFAMNKCICRDAGSCVSYPHDIGCLFIGEAARGINPALGREVSVAEAKMLQKKVEQAGLINLVGKNRLDKICLGVDPAERLLTVCHCCECCCLWKIITKASDSIAQKVHRMEGVEVSVNGSCSGCGECVESCFVNAVTVTNGRALINDKMCRGCGRCVIKCRQEAVELFFSESDCFQKCVELISSLEERIDVT